MPLPDIELVSAQVHEAWMESKRAQGVASRQSESGEELMVPYAELSEAAKELDRGTVRAVYAAIEATMPTPDAVRHEDASAVLDRPALTSVHAMLQRGMDGYGSRMTAEGRDYFNAEIRRLGALL